MAAPVVSPVRGGGPDSGACDPSAGKLMSLSHSLAADVLSRTSSNTPNNATESSRACGRAGVIAPFLRFRARPKPPRSGVLDQATLALVPLNLDGYPTPQDPFSGWSRSMSNPASRSNSPRGSAAGLHPGRAHQPSSGRQPTRPLVCPPARQNLHARRLRRIDILVRPTDAAILAGRNGSGPDGRQSGNWSKDGSNTSQLRCPPS
jgi:hypothetical protein